MKTRNFLPKVIGFFLAFALTFTSCSPSKTFKPGKSSLPQSPSGKEYSLIELDPEAYPDQAMLLEQETATYSTGDGTITTTSLSARGSTDDNGVVLFDDPALPAPLPIVIVDSNNQPVEGGSVHILDEGTFLLISFTDPLGRYASDWVIVEKAELVAGSPESMDESAHSFGGGVRTAKAIAPLLALLIVVVIIELGLVAVTVIKLDKDPQQVTKLSDYDRYVCKTPERIGAELNLEVSIAAFVVGMASGGMSIGVHIIYEVGSVLAATVAEKVVNNIVEAPILFHWYYINPATTEIIMEGEGIDSIPYQGASLEVWEEVGKCAFVPDVVTLPKNEAVEALEESELDYEIIYVDQGGAPLIYRETGADILTVINQDPGPMERNDRLLWEDNMVEKMLPIGDYPGLENTVTLTVQVIPQTSSLPPVITDIPVSPDTWTGPYLILDRNYFCNEGPGKYYSKVTAFPAGTRLPLVGSNGAGWWEVAVEYQRVPTCWIGGGGVDGDAAQVPITEAPPPPPSAELGTGDVQITLTWSNTTDLDLIVIDPFGEMIYFGDEFAASGGILDHDANAACTQTTYEPVENIYWPYGEAPEGSYTVYVRYYQQCDGYGATQYHVRVLVDGSVTEYDGTIGSADDEVLVVTFER